MGGDLNLKKSWHPLLLANQERVWREQKRVLDERKKIKQLSKDRAQERHITDLINLHESTRARKQEKRLDWMYSSTSVMPNQSLFTDSYERRCNLLGTRTRTSKNAATSSRAPSDFRISPEGRSLIFSNFDDTKNEKELKKRACLDPLSTIPRSPSFK